MGSPGHVLASEVAASESHGIASCGNDTNSAGGLRYTSPVATGTIYRVKANQTATVVLDAVEPTWLTRNSGGGARRFVPDLESLSFSYIDGSGGPVIPATNQPMSRPWP